MQAEPFKTQAVWVILGIFLIFCKVLVFRQGEEAGQDLGLKMLP